MDMKKYRVDSDKFRAARKSMGYTIQRLADELRCSESQIAKYEKGGAYIKEEKLSKICSLLKKEPTEIIVENFPDDANFEDSIDYLRWKFLLDCIVGNFGVGGTYLHFRDCVEIYCAPYWKQLSKNSEIKVKETASKEETTSENLPDNSVYMCTRKYHFKKKDLFYLTEIERTFFIYRAQPESAFSLAHKDHKIFEYFMCQIPKMKAIIAVLEKQSKKKTDETSNSIDTEKLHNFLEQLNYAEQEGTAIDKAQQKKIKEGFFSPDDFEYGVEQADYWEDMVFDEDIRLWEDIQGKTDTEEIIKKLLQQFGGNKNGG